jgi:hypothetical protein
VRQGRIYREEGRTSPFSDIGPTASFLLPASAEVFPESGLSHHMLNFYHIFTLLRRRHQLTMQEIKVPDRPQNRFQAKPR